MMRSPRRFAPAAAIALLPILATYACVDAPSAPSGFAGPGILVIAPSFATIDQSGPAAAPSASSALDEAFNRVNRFRLQARRQDGSLAVDTVISVEPGQDVYDLSVNVTVSSANELFLVTLTALEGDTELFKSEPIPVTATPPDQAAGPVTPVTIPLTYSGPGAYASQVDVAPGNVVVGLGGTVQVGAKVLTSQEVVVADVPLVWSSEATSIATVSSTGLVTGVAAGITRIRATTPTGLQSSARVYVVDGTLAYVQGGRVMVRAAAGGDAAARSSGSSAHGPAWAADGGSLFYSEGGQVTKAGGAALFEGAWPTVSPDGTKIAVERSGQVWFANDDGSNPTEGPAGTTPVWTAGHTLVVGGGSVEQVGVDGAGRTTLVPGDVGMPAVDAGGAIAYVEGGALEIVGGGTVATGVTGRPSWSADGRFLAVPGAGGMLLVPADGSAPPVALPGLDGATDPAWQPAGALVAPAALSVTGTDPDPPIPGEAVTLLGSGFDDIIPANNHVFWPTGEGSTETPITSMTATGLSTTMPLAVVAGQIRVVRYNTTAMLDYVPTFGALVVHARTPWDAAVAGVALTVTNSTGSVVATGSTDDSGDFLAAGLLAGTYEVGIGVPAYFDLSGSTTRSVSITAASIATLPLTLTPHVVKAALSPSSPSMGVYDEVPVTVRALDVNGNTIPTVTTATWTSGTGRLSIRPSGLSATLVGRSPSTTGGDATFSVILGGETFGFGATVTSSISGTVTDAGSGNPVPNVSIGLKNGAAEVARTGTDAAGHYRVVGLYAGTYSVGPTPPAGKAANPTSRSVTLDGSSPTGTADFVLSDAAVGEGDIVVVNDWNIWDSYTNGPTLVQNLVATANNDGNKVVWWCGRQGNPSGTSLYGGICAGSISSDGSGQFGGTRDAITAAGWDFVVDYQTPLTSIPSDVRVFWLWTPTEQLSNAEVDVLKSFAARGGRIVFNSDYRESWYTTDHHANIETRLLSQLGTGITSTGDLRYGSPQIVAPDDPIMAGVTHVYFGSPGDMTVSSPAKALVDDGSGHVLIAWAPVDATPLPSELVTAAAQAAPPVRPHVPAKTLRQSNCVPGLVCRKAPVPGPSKSPSPTLAPAAHPADPSTEAKPRPGGGGS